MSFKLKNLLKSSEKHGRIERKYGAALAEIRQLK